MSVFVRIEREGLTPRVARLRGLIVEVGEDSLGLLTAEAPVEPFFALFQVGADYWIQPQGSSQDEKAGGRSAVPDEALPAAPVKVTPGLMLPYKGYSFTFWPAAPQSELMAHVEGAEDELVTSTGEAIGRIQVAFGQSHADYPLFRSVCYRVGSSHDVAIPVPYPEVQPVHCELWVTDDVVSIRPLQGGVSLEGGGLTAAASGTPADSRVIRGVLPLRVNLNPGGAGLLLERI